VPPLLFGVLVAPAAIVVGVVPVAAEEAAAENGRVSHELAELLAVGWISRAVATPASVCRRVSPH
jgi:hypothetical protein